MGTLMKMLISRTKLGSWISSWARRFFSLRAQVARGLFLLSSTPVSAVAHNHSGEERGSLDWSPLCCAGDGRVPVKYPSCTTPVSRKTTLIIESIVATIDKKATLESWENGLRE